MRLKSTVFDISETKNKRTRQKQRTSGKKSGVEGFMYGSKGVFIWRRASPLDRASPSKGAEFYRTFTWKFSGPFGKAGSSTHA